MRFGLLAFLLTGFQCSPDDVSTPTQDLTTNVDLGNSSSPDMGSTPDMVTATDLTPASDLVVVPHGTVEVKNVFSLTARNLPQDMNVGNPILFRAFDLCTEIEDGFTDALAGIAYPNPEALALITVTRGQVGSDTTLGSVVPTNDPVTVHFARFAIVAGTCEHINLWGTLAPLYPGNTGKQIGLGLSSGYEGGEWAGGGYANSFNIRVVGATSGQTLYAPVFPLPSEVSVVRATNLTVQRGFLSSDVLSPGATLDLFPADYNADLLGDLTIAMITLKLDANTAGFSLGNFHVLVNNNQLHQDDYFVFDETGKNVTHSTVNPALGGTLAFVFSPRLVVSHGSYIHVTPQATGNGTVMPGDFLSIRRASSAIQGPMTGFLADNGTMAPPLLDTGLNLGDGPLVEQSILWSDQSDPVNNRDWTGDFLVQDPSFTFTYFR